MSHSPSAPDSGRRRFLQLMGTTVAIPAMSACTRQPEEHIVPFVHAPETTPGTPKFYATATLREGVATGVLVETHEGRPTKVEGNPEHPSSLGSTDAIQQAETLRLYDPERSRAVRNRGAISSWSAYLEALSLAMTARRSERGKGLCLLTGSVTSPTVRRQIEALLEELPEARWYVHEPAHHDGDLRGAEAAFGEPLQPVYTLEDATVVVGLDADPMVEGPVRLTREWSAARRRGIEGGEPLRSWALECAPGLFGAMADHTVAVSPAALESTARHLAARILGSLSKAQRDALVTKATLPPGVTPAWLDAVAADLKAAGPKAVVMAGRFQPAIVHELAHRMNAELGSVGKGLRFIDPVRPTAAGELAALHQRLVAGEVKTLVMVDVNPVYSAPSDVDFAAGMARAEIRFHLGHHFDETGERCEWHAALAHPFEAWGDALAEDGLASVMQPLIEPLHSGRSEVELMAALLGHPETSGRDAVRETWRERLGVPGRDAFERAWRRVLHDGFQAGGARAARDVEVAEPTFSPASDAGGLSLVIRPSPWLRGGRYAGNGWLQELPQPLTKLTWDNVALIAPSLASKLKLEVGDVVRLTVGEASVEAPVMPLAGVPHDVVTVHLGYGRKRAGRVGTDVGFSAYRVQTTKNRWHSAGLAVSPIGREHQLAFAQQHQSMEGRDLVRSARLDAYRADPHVLDHGHHKPLSLYPDKVYEGYSWGMTIDLTSCVGCSACVTACQAENNIPVVGKEEVARGREMHWIRVDHYVDGPAEQPTHHFQPVPCMHCEQAPCEVVCPVQATVHHPEGLNDMVYNRCVGTRYCSNNCPYKVRRFNYFGYATTNVGPVNVEAPINKLGRNPDVTVRTRGVMEKCTYCVQRISFARIRSKREGRRIRDGEVMTACQTACPAQAITFGDISDPNSAVSAAKAEARNYGILEELNTKPRTTYLAKLTNPSPTLAGPPKAGGHGDGHGSGDHGGEHG